MYETVDESLVVRRITCDLSHLLCRLLAQMHTPRSVLSFDWICDKCAYVQVSNRIYAANDNLMITGISGELSSSILAYVAQQT